MTTGLVGWKRCFVGYLCTVGAFFAIAYGLGALAPRLGLEGTALMQVVLKGVMVLAACVFWVALRRPWREMGWRGMAWKRGMWKLVIAGCVPMMVASVVMVMSGFRHPVMSKLSFLEVVLEIWIVSSVAEEIFVRGAMQGWCEIGVGEDALRRVFAPSVVMSAAAFATMHVPLMWLGAGVVGGGAIVLATLVVGWVCAILRARTGSLWAAIGMHILANVAAVPGGIVGVVLHRIVYGTLPDFGS